MSLSQPAESGFDIRCVRAFLRSVLVLLTASAWAMPAMAAADRGAEVAKLIAQIDSPEYTDHIAAARHLWDFSGLTDPAIYERIERFLVASEKGRGIERHLKNELAWFAKALASSGDPRYLPTLEAIAKLQGVDSGVKNHAEKAAEILPRFTRWNAIINSDANAAPGQPEDVTRALNMVKSGEAELLRGGLRIMKRHRKEMPQLYEVIEKELRRIDWVRAEAERDLPVLDTTAWLCRGLGQSGDEKYAAMLLEMHRAAKTRKVSYGCKKGLQILQKTLLGEEEPDEDPAAAPPAEKP